MHPRATKSYKLIAPESYNQTMLRNRSTISLTVQTLIDSKCLSTIPFSFSTDLSLNSSEISGQPPHDHDSSDESEHTSPLLILNAVKLSLMLSRACAQYCDDAKNGIDLGSLRLDDFIVTLQYSSIGGEEDPRTSRAAGEEQLFIISTVDQINAINMSDCIRWIILDMDVKRSDARLTSENINVATLMLSLGKLLHAIFSPNNDAMAPDGQCSNEDAKGINEISAPDEQYSNGDVAVGNQSTRRGSKMRRSANTTSLFQQLIEAGYPTSVCRLLHDLIDRADTHLSIQSFDDIICDLEQMISQPHVFLHNPENEFYTSAIHFGQKYYGRSKELAKILEIATVPHGTNCGLEVMLVSGVAGSGKSHLASAVGDFVSNFGFMVLTAKFNRGMEYTSREIVSTLMDEIVSNIVEMKDSGNDSDVDYIRRVSRALSTALDASSLSVLVDFVPSIQILVPGVVKKENLLCSHWQLVFLLSKLLCSVLSQDRKIFLTIDDLQWADPTVLQLISDILISISKCPEERQRLIFVGMYRDNEVSSDLMLFITNLMNLEGVDRANVNSVKVSTLSLDDVTEMVMSELRLPRRLVSKLADVVHKRTHGHALFVVQLLNSLVSDSTIAYSPMLHRFNWDQDKICSLKTADNVASLIVSNLTSLPSEELLCLRIISCFGIKVQFNLLEFLEVLGLAPTGGFKPYLRNLNDQGIIEIGSTFVVFTHDLIQEQVYEGTPEKERRQLHCDIGIYLGSKTSLGANFEHEPIDVAIGQLRVSRASNSEDSYIGITSLVSIATSQINNAGPEFFSDRMQRTRFASWNLRAGKDAAEKSSFRAALHYYKHGIAFLGDDLWLEDTYDLCLKLYEGAALSSSALCEETCVLMYANEIINNVIFEDSLLAEYLLIGSLHTSGQCKHSIARGLAVLRQLKIDIPATPSPEVVMLTMKQTKMEASIYNFSQISDCQRRVDSKTRNILKLVDAISKSCYQIGSPFLPLVACATVRYSLQNGVCEESISAFIIFAYFQMFLTQSLESGRQWGNIAKSMLEEAAKGTVMTSAPRFLLFAFVNMWYVPLQESINHLQETEDMNLKFGDTDRAYMAQCMKFRFLFFRGEKLSILSHDIGTNLQSMTRFSPGSVKYSVLDKEMIDSLTGDKSSNPYGVLDGIIRNKQSLLADAQSKMHFQIVEAVHLQNFFLSFWMGDYEEAAKASDLAMSFPTSKMPKVQLIYHIFYRGIVMFHLYREGKGEHWLKEGKKMQDQLETWVNTSKPIFENKLILLEAESYASTCNVVAAKESYELSIKVARDNGYIHEQGLAYECMGKYLMSAVEVRDAERCFLSAHRCYMQWGAKAKAKKLWMDWNLDSSTEGIGPCTIKHERS